MSHLYILVPITTKHKKRKRLPFKCHCYHGESTLIIQRIPQPQKRHYQISTVDLPANIQSKFIISLILNTLNITSEFYLNSKFYVELPRIF